MKPTPRAPRKVFVMVTAEVRPIAEILLRKLATITAIIPPTGIGYTWRYDLENRDWPSGDFNQATVNISETRDGSSATMTVELVMV